MDGPWRWRLGKDDAGAAAVEFAVLAPVLILAMVAVVDIGVAVHRSIQVTNAAAFATSYVTVDPTATDEELSKAVSDAVPGITVTTVRTTFCECDGVAMGDCSDSCNGAKTQYVKVTASASVDTIITYPGFEYPIEVSGSATQIMP